MTRVAMLAFLLMFIASTARATMSNCVVGQDGTACVAGCLSGTCLGGVCNGATLLADNMPCATGNPCTQGDMCQGGSCIAGSLIAGCSYTPVADMLAADQGIADGGSNSDAPAAWHLYGGGCHCAPPGAAHGRSGWVVLGLPLLGFGSVRRLTRPSA